MRAGEQRTRAAETIDKLGTEEPRKKILCGARVDRRQVIRSDGSSKKQTKKLFFLLSSSWVLGFLIHNFFTPRNKFMLVV